MQDNFNKDAFKNFLKDMAEKIIQSNFDFAAEFKKYTGKDWEDFSKAQSQQGKRAEAAFPAVNLIETPESFIIEVAAPGLEKENFSIQVHNDSLTISTKLAQEQPQGYTYKRREFDYSKFQRSFKIPEAANKDEVSAKYERGILEITILKKEEEITRAGREIRIV